MSARRFQYHVIWDTRLGAWVCKVGGALVCQAGCSDQKSDVVVWMAWLLQRFSELGQRSELIIHRKDGTIGKGPSSRRTYGADPRGAKG